jgi:hypothetical protein
MRQNALDKVIFYGKCAPPFAFPVAAYLGLIGTLGLVL